jgi:hypothetical protein
MKKNCIFFLTDSSYLDIFYLNMSIVDNTKIDKLQCTFPKLTEANQQYMLGVAEGLRYAQSNASEIPEKRPLRDNGQRGKK